MSSRPKRTIKAKKKDDEIYTSICEDIKSSPSVVAKRKVSEENKDKNGKQDLKRKKIVKAKITDVNAAIYKRLQETLKTEPKTDGTDDDNDEDDDKSEGLPRKRIPKPSFKLQLEEESSDDYLPSDESGLDSDECEPKRTPKKPRNGSVRSPKRDSNKRTETHKEGFTTPCKIDKNTEVTIKEEQVDVMTVSQDKDQLTGRDKIIQLPNNRTYFEFAEPKKKVILQIKAPYDSLELKSQTLYELVSSLKIRNMIDSDGQELLEAFREFPDTLIRINTKTMKLPKIYTEEVKKFATVLYIYAPKAYDLVSNNFFLPLKSELQERLLSKNYWPGLAEEALEILLKAGFKDPVEKVCSIMIDFVPIKKERHKLSHDEKWLGHVDFSGGPTPDDSDEVPLASEVLLLTVVGIGWDWKLPFGYFLCNGLSGEALHSIVIEAIRVVEEAELRVKAIVCDGFPNTIKMGLLFGCNIHTKFFTEIVSSFPHPLDCKRKIHFVFGVRRALVLLRNLLADRNILRSSTYGIIKWKFFRLLWGDKKRTMYETNQILKPDHLKFYNMLRLLRCCHPTFSCTENMAFELANDLKIKEYKGSDAAANFVADIYRAFDLLNSRNPVTSGEKPPITNPFLPEQLESMSVIGQRIFGLEFLSGTGVNMDGRWLSVMLFAFTLKSVSLLASELLAEKSLMYFTTYRVNLDHSDMILNCIQRFGGWEDVPTAAEFRTGYKRLLESSRKIFKVSSFCSDFEGNDLTIGQGIICPFKVLLPILRYNDIEFAVEFPPITDLSIDSEAQAKCILRCISQRLTCALCMFLLLDNESSNDGERNRIIIDDAKPSKLLRDILKISGSVFKQRSLLPRPEIEHLVMLVFGEFLSDFWKTQYIQNDHMLEEPYHFVSLIKVVIRIYLRYKFNASKHIPALKSGLFRDS